MTSVMQATSVIGRKRIEKLVDAPADTRRAALLQSNDVLFTKDFAERPLLQVQLFQFRMALTCNASEPDLQMIHERSCNSMLNLIGDYADNKYVMDVAGPAMRRWGCPGCDV